MKILILGGTGAMGKSLVQILSNSEENEVFITSRKQYKSEKNKYFIQGNAHDFSFISELLKDRYDAIVDFMVYTPSEFKGRVRQFLNATKQYIFLSSCRVFADSEEKMLTENSPRLLDVSDDKVYLSTDEYALAKAREENILYDLKEKNWTIIRPYITYNDERLQLGTFEKESWLFRAMNGKKIVFPKDIADKYTTMTYGYDVAKIISELIGNEKAYGESFNITTEQFIKWNDVLDLYIKVIEEKTGYKPTKVMPMNSKFIGDIFDNKYQVCYDRLYNRRFCNNKVNDVLGYKYQYTDIRNGLEKCLTNYISKNKSYMNMFWRHEAHLDKLSGDKTSILKIGSMKQRILYGILRYTRINL